MSTIRESCSREAKREVGMPVVLRSGVADAVADAVAVKVVRLRRSVVRMLRWRIVRW